jgi:phosphotransferase system enzyme I (PtsI)
VEEVRSELAQHREPFDKNIEIGTMIELPSAAIMADVLAKEASFFSIGTNDLIQYTMAADRVNERVAYLYNPLHPAILRLIKRVIEAAHEQRIWVGMCGEMAADPFLTPLLVGLGLDEFSTGSAFIPQLKKSIREIEFAKARSLADEVMQCSTASEIEGLLEKQGGTRL